jgi:Leucine-rich repeat (LRR) protein
LTKLSELNLSGNQIDDVSPLSGLTQLTELNLSNNEISDLKRLTGLIQLTELNLNNNKIEDIRPLSDLTHLERLYLSNNEISDIRPLTDLTQLKRLDLGSNWISDVSPLSGMAQLTELNLTNNEISDTSPLSGLTHLSEIDISGNPIEAQNDSDDSVEEREAQQDTTVPGIDMGAIVQVTASSSLSERGMVHSPDRLIDNDVTKAWVEGVNGLGSGEWVRLTFDDTYAINGITISQGFQESRDMYEKNARPSRIRVFCDGYSEEIFLEDIKKSTQVTLYKYNNRPLGIRVKEQFSRLLSPIL